MVFITKTMICDDCKFFDNHFEKTGTPLLKQVKKCNEVNMKDSLSFKLSLMTGEKENCSYYIKKEKAPELYQCFDEGLDCVDKNGVCGNPYHTGEFYNEINGREKTIWICG